MVVLVAGKRQAEALDGIGDEAGRQIVLDGMEGLEHGRHVVTGEVGHHRLQAGIVVGGEEGGDAREMPEIALEMSAPAFAALEHQRRIERVRAGIDPLAQRHAVGPGKGRFELLAVFQRDDAPAHGAEQRIDAAEQPVADHGIEALAVVVDHPPEVADIVLPAFEHGLEDIALIELGIAHHRHHPAGRQGLRQQAFEPNVILHQRREAGERDAEADGAGGEIDVAAILGPGRVGLRAAQRPERLQLGQRLPAQQVFEGVIDRAGMRLHRDPVLRPQHVEIERGHQGHHGGARGLMAANLEPVAARTQVVGVVDHPGGEPQHLALQRLQQGEPVGFGLSGRSGWGGRQCGPGRGCGHTGLLSGPTVRLTL